jgi:glutaredoxin-like protein NrdH
MPKIPVTVYTNPQCVQCDMTKKQFDKFGIEYSVVDLSTVPDKLEEFKGLGLLSAPIVTTDVKIWSGFKPAKIKSLVDYIHSMERRD